MRGFLNNLAPHLAADEDFMDIDMDPEDAVAIMEAMGEHLPQEKLLDADFYNGKFQSRHLLNFCSV